MEFNEELSFERRPFFEIVISEKLKTLELDPLPMNWINKIETTADTTSR